MNRTGMGLHVIAVGLCLIAVLAVGDVRAEKPTATITGTVEAAESSRGKVISVYIKDPDNVRFLVVRSTEVGKELLEKVGVTVTATGYVKKTRPESKFPQIIDVLSYEVDAPREQP